MKNILRALLILFPLTLSEPAAAYEPLSKRFDVDRLLFTKYYAAQFKAAFDGDCVALMAVVRPEELGWEEPATIESDPILFRRIFAAIEMFDRGICVPADPERVTRYFNDTLAVNGHLASTFLLELAWRAWNGFAMPQDRGLAREYILESLLRRTTFLDVDETLSRHTRTGRSLPNYAREIYQWIIDHTRTEEARIEFGIGIADGTLFLPDGTALGVRPLAAYGILSSYRNYSETLVRSAFIEKSGILGATQIFPWESTMYFAAECGVIEAMQVMIPLYLSEEQDQEINHYHALVALWRLQQHGFNTEEEMRQISETYDMAHFWDYVDRGWMPLYGKDKYCNWKQHISPPSP